MKELNDKQLYEQLKAVGSTIETSDQHKLESPFIDSIVGTLEYFGVNDRVLQISNIVLRQDKIKIFDFLGVILRGGMNDSVDEVSNKNLHDGIRKIIQVYIEQKNVGGFGWWLRGHDFDHEEPHRCVDCIRSYDEWSKETPEQRHKQAEDLKKGGWTIL